MQIDVRAVGALPVKDASLYGIDGMSVSETSKRELLERPFYFHELPLGARAGPCLATTEALRRRANVAKTAP